MELIKNNRSKIDDMVDYYLFVNRNFIESTSIIYFGEILKDMVANNLANITENEAVQLLCCYGDMPEEKKAKWLNQLDMNGNAATVDLTKKIYGEILLESIEIYEKRRKENKYERTL